ncbi:hypothetical protein NVP2117O_63 [Vibrio phage 2.117.O._10N.261.45.E9]|nr:hypothetical protein NVP1117O_63 [Vibrio phage 1.117.O._10N.261.45.E9]AUR95464.1 hypothetical protein NVP1207B_57 [Vibrio phage 1.207.B._10N.222.51.C2]AUS02355.1 hypothetical protein NVP2117O_63 [Vibrio phage 2.117.O._10N.261.45.E9]
MNTKDGHDPLSLKQSPDLKRAQTLLANGGYIATCANCTHREGEDCGKYKMRPPIQVIASGCDDWEFHIPF